MTLLILFSGLICIITWESNIWLCISGDYTARKWTSHIWRERPLRHCEGDGKVTFTRLFLMLCKVTFDEEVNILERYCKGNVPLTFLFPKSKVLKGLVSHSVINVEMV